jgi:hypothetical protein
MSIPDLLVQPLLAVFPHGLQHHSRRNAHRAMGLAAAGRRDRLVASVSPPSATPALTALESHEAEPALVSAR